MTLSIPTSPATLILMEVGVLSHVGTEGLALRTGLVLKSAFLTSHGGMKVDAMEGDDAFLSLRFRMTVPCPSAAV